MKSKLWLAAITLLLFACNRQKAKPKEQMAFDAPALIGASTDELKEVLGDPYTQDTLTTLQKNNGITSDLYYHIDRYNLIITVDPFTNLVKEIFVSDSAGLVETTVVLKQISGTDHDHDRIVVKSVPAMTEKSKYTGITISR